MMTLYALLFVEIFYFKPRLSSFIVKLIAVQAMFIETFPNLFTSVFTTDNARDFFIAESILKNAGGIPQNFTGIVWYNFSPVVPLTYAMQSLAINISPFQAEIMSGFTFVLLSVLAIGSIALKVSGSVSQSMLSMWIACLVPFAWEYATFPVPEMVAVAMVLLVICIIMQSNTSMSAVASSILIVVVVLTHGGVAIELIAIVSFIYFMTRNRFALRATLFALTVFTMYTVYAAVVATPSGIIALLQILESVGTLVNSATVYVSGNSLMTIVQSATASFWWVFLGVFSWISFVELLKKVESNQRMYQAFLLGGLVLFSVGIGLLIQPVAQTQTIRYVSLISYMMLCVPAATGLVMLGSRKHGGRLLVLIAVTVFIITSVPNNAVSSDFWHDIGQNGYASFRMIWTETSLETSSQIYLNTFDRCYVVAANYLPEFVNISFSPGCPGSTGFTLQGNTFINQYFIRGFVIGGVASAITNVEPPLVVLTSTRLSFFSPVTNKVENPAANITVTSSNLIYSDPYSQIAFVGVQSK